MVSFLKVLLDRFKPNLHISNNNPASEPVCTICINWNLCPAVIDTPMKNAYRE